LEKESGTESPTADLVVQVPLVFLNANNRKLLSKLGASHPEISAFARKAKIQFHFLIFREKFPYVNQRSTRCGSSYPPTYPTPPRLPYDDRHPGCCAA